MNKTTALEYIKKIKDEKIFKTDKFLDRFIEEELYKKLEENSKETEIISLILDRYGEDAMDDMLASESTRKYVKGTCMVYNLFYLLMTLFAYYFMLKNNGSLLIFLMNSLVAALGLQGMAIVREVEKTLKEDSWWSFL